MTFFSYGLMCYDIVNSREKYILHPGMFSEMCVHKKQSGKMYDELTTNFVLFFNKAAETEHNLCKLEKKHS